MWIVFLLLKTIGIALLVILAIVLLILGYLLFAPITYRAGVGYDSSTRAFVAVYDALRIVRFTFTYRDKSFSRDIRILWGLIAGKKKKVSDAADEYDGDFDEAALDDSFDEEDERSLSDSFEDDEQASSAVSNETYTDPADWSTEQSSTEAEADLPDIARSEDREESILTSEKLDDEKKFQNEPDEDEEKKQKSPLKKYYRMITDERNKAAVALLWRKVTGLIYHIRPHIKSADLGFATGSPDKTGYLVGLIAVCPGAYGKNVRIAPDFSSEELYAKGYLDIYGHVRLCYVALYAIQIVLNGSCRRLYRQIRA